MDYTFIVSVCPENCKQNPEPRPGQNPKTSWKSKEDLPMNVYKLYFSPTGGTKKAADLLTDALAPKAAQVNLTDSKTALSDLALTAEDLAVIAVPSYAGRVPAVAVQRLAAVKGNGARAVLVCVYGNRAYEDTLVELADTAKEAGFRVMAAVSAIAEHSIARQFAAGRPDAEDAQRLAGFAKQIQEKLARGEDTEPSLPGNRPYKKTSGSKLVPKPTSDCTRCGLCAAECPVQAIRPEDPKKVDESACIGCMRCVAVCPQSARRVNPVMLSAVGLALKKVCSDRKECELFLE